MSRVGGEDRYEYRASHHRECVILKDVPASDRTAINGQGEADDRDRRAGRGPQCQGGPNRAILQNPKGDPGRSEDEGYRKAVESFTRQRLKVCREEEDWETIEKKLGCGQVEELIEEARDELVLIDKLNQWKPWGVPDHYECEVIENDAPVPKHVPLHRPGPLPEEFYKTLEDLTTNQAKLDEAKATSIGSESKE
ncbi:putative NADH dehydrogenase [Prunus yedoensis var. nudiflora]|uniref:Putative NADH dehydrogenase n=1 Tax=Prunus yedoensis var. nudiflora TaxID=2094558 RepID=A0A314URZ0_PRUYE|nr:putative NADH dehydrogenase [Prunus yedoensis var. nudiflora]